MKVLKPFAPGDLRVVDAPEPEPGEGWVKIAVRASGICGSDKWYWRSGPTDVVAGHEVAGEVTALGPGVRHLAEGDRVAVNNAVGCGHCAECRARRFVRCMRRPGRDVDNGFSEFLIAPERNCLVLDDAVDYVAGSLVLDNWGTPYAALNWASVREGDDVVVTGCGPIGLGSVGIAKLSGAYVIALDPLEYRRDAAVRMGADVVLEPGDGAADAIRELTSGEGASVVVECSSKAASYATALDALRMRGRLVSVGEHAEFTLRPSEHMIRKNLSIIASWYTTMGEGEAVQRLMVERRIEPKAFVTHVVSLDEAPEAFRRVIECTDGVIKTVITIPG